MHSSSCALVGAGFIRNFHGYSQIYKNLPLEQWQGGGFIVTYLENFSLLVKSVPT